MMKQSILSTNVKRQHTFVRKAKENSPHPVTPRSDSDLSNRVGMTLKGRGFLRQEIAPNNVTKVYFITQKGLDYLVQLDAVVSGKLLNFEQIEYVYSELLADERPDLAGQLLITAAFHRGDFEALSRLKTILTPRLRAAWDAWAYIHGGHPFMTNTRLNLDILPTFPTVPYAKHDKQTAFNLSAFDSQNLSAIQDYLAAQGISSTASDAMWYAISIATFIVKGLAIQFGDTPPLGAEIDVETDSTG